MKHLLPNDLIILICGVPGAGKTTISIEILKRYSEFRLIEETDLIREILRGYNQYLNESNIYLEENIYPHTIHLSYEMAKQQCIIMRNSIINIIKRQKRKKIPTIINGVHIIPEILYDKMSCSNMIFINLYFSSENSLWERLKVRTEKKYTQESASLLYKTNIELQKNVENLINSGAKNIFSIDVSRQTINETLSFIDSILCSHL